MSDENNNIEIHLKDIKAKLDSLVTVLGLIFVSQLVLIFLFWFK